MMALLNCLKFKMGSSGRRRSKRVDDHATADADDDYCSTTYNDPSTSLKVEVEVKVKVADDDEVMIKRYSWAEIHRIADNFSRVIGEGGFSTVYLGQYNHHHHHQYPLAVKIHRNTSSSQRLSRLFKQELQIMLQIRHPNIVKLLGYCSDDEQEEGALVLEYVPNGSLHDKLHHDDDDDDDENYNKNYNSSSIGIGRGGRGGRGVPLPWNKRMQIAFQLAEAIDYLHSSCPLQIVHGDIKSSNVLLDNNLNCRLCDFGSAKMGFSSSVNHHVDKSSSSSILLLAGSPGYIDPHYLRTGIASKKNDVYSFGVILLELITGMEAFNSSHNQKLLTSILTPAILKNDNLMSQMTDPRLAASGGFPPHHQLVSMTSLAAQCILPQPTLRPSMADIVGIIMTTIDTT
ncbi:hypothetical protein Scep_025110 [Stephania cephalantha]|uniref:Protein kinase domain-containing protein n=1 Tax=Stephania cephalantha TaxID=152367 RepID=A0AAP0EHL1_9MAGN